MSDRFQKMKSEELLRVVSHRGAVSHELGCPLLQLSVATTEDEMRNPKQIMLCIAPDTAEKIISSLQKSLSILRQSN